ncbi:MAG: protein tyrosine phosphatase family protein [Pirellulaceae bacterium]
MTQQMQISEEVTVGGQPSGDKLEQLAKDGFKTVVNLRTEGEEDQPLSPNAEGEKVRELGMEYVHFPVSRDEMSPELEDEFRQRLPSFATPVFVHCGSGKRAGAFVVMDKAIKEGWSGEATLQRAEEMGFECNVPEIKEFVKSYVDSRQS